MYNVREYEMRTLSKSGDFSEVERLVYNHIKLPGMILVILCYVLQSVEFLGPLMPSFQTWTLDSPLFKPE